MFLTSFAECGVLPYIIAPFHNPHPLQIPPFTMLAFSRVFWPLSLNLYVCTSKCMKPSFTFFMVVDVYMVVPHWPHSWNGHPLAALPALTLFGQVICFDQIDISELRPNKFLYLSIGPLRTFCVENRHHGVEKLGLGYWIVRRLLESEREVTRRDTDTWLVSEGFLHHLFQSRCQLNAANLLKTISYCLQ